MKQTAVEWIYRWVNDNPEATHKEFEKAFEQAKQMEKEQIIKFTEDFVDNFVYGTYDGESYQTKEISEYYNEIYEKSL